VIGNGFVLAFEELKQENELPKSLVIVESPAKAKTINKYLGKDYEVEASLGHIKDLPKSKLGVDIEGDFSTEYDVIPGKEKVVAKLKKLAKDAAAIYLAPDPDREGEAIAAHLAEELTDGFSKKKKDGIPVHRVTFNEITKKAVQEAFQHPRDIDRNLVDAQQTRRVLDRIVGYQVSPLLWDKVRRGLSAGRVQTVALRLIVDRERLIRAFLVEEYWTITAHLGAQEPPSFEARLINRSGTDFVIGGEGESGSIRAQADKGKLLIANEAEAQAIRAEVEKQKFVVTSTVTKERRRSPAPPPRTRR